jgi:trk system potassium uptake protein
MLNNKAIIYILGMLLIIESAAMLPSIALAAWDSGNSLNAFLISFGLTLGAGLVMKMVVGRASKDIGKREGYIIVSLVWVVFSFSGSLPYVLSGAIPSYTDAFFETMSGFTTTGASVLDNIEQMPRSLLLWRSMTQWLGGMGIIVLSLAVLPMLGIGGNQLFSAEVSGPAPDKISPRVRETAQKLWGMYIAFTALQTLLLILGGMSFFDAINHSFATMSSGGYSTKQASVAFFESAYIEYIICIFMFIAGMNFTLAFFALNLKFKKVWRNEEFRSYVYIVGFATLLISAVLALSKDYGYEQAFRSSLFQVISILTSTGFGTDDYLAWGPMLSMVIFLLMFVGGSAGSTSGGMKIVRIVLLAKNAYVEMRKLLHPSAIIPVRLDRQAVDPAIISNVLAFIVFYIMIFVVSVVIMSSLNLDIETSMGAVVASISNIGPGLGSVGPSASFAHIPDAGKWFLAFLMLIGRLELFTVIILFTPVFWRK